jgi:hypothetical protein
LDICVLFVDELLSQTIRPAWWKQLEQTDVIIALERLMLFATHESWSMIIGSLACIDAVREGARIVQLRHVRCKSPWSSCVSKVNVARSKASSDCKAVGRLRASM